MGDDDQTEKPTPQGPKPQEPGPSAPSGDGATAEKPATPDGDETMAEKPATPDDAARELTPPPDATALIPPAAADATTQLRRPDDATTQMRRPDDATTQLPAAPDHTRVMPPARASWEGRAEVRAPQPGMRDSAPYPLGTEPSKGRTWWTPLLLGLLALGLVGIVILAAWLLGREAPEPELPASPAPIVPTSATPVAPTTPAAAPSPTPAGPQLVPVPVLVGDTQAAATAKLDAAGLSYRFDFRRSNSPRDTVIATDPEAGAQVPRLSTVVLVISLGPGDTSPTARPRPSGSAVPG